MLQLRKRLFGAVFFLPLLVWGAQAALYPAKPGPSHFYSDDAGMISPEGARSIDQICFALWKEQRVPIYVVTITSLRNYGASEKPIESYAYELFNAWGIGSQKRNQGMLLLVSKGTAKPGSNSAPTGDAGMTGRPSS